MLPSTTTSTGIGILTWLCGRPTSRLRAATVYKRIPVSTRSRIPISTSTTITPRLLSHSSRHFLNKNHYLHEKQLRTLHSTSSSLIRATKPERDMTKGVDFYSLKAALPGEGKVYDFEQLRGKVVLIVNVASKCGFTPQYKGLEALYQKHKDKDFVILGFPCNQFGGQEPGTDEEISKFCELNHGVTFPLTKKSDVNGDNTNEVYKWLKDEKAGILGLTRIKWNFEKFLIDKEGKVVHRWASTTSPESIDAEVQKLL